MAAAGPSSPEPANAPRTPPATPEVLAVVGGAFIAAIGALLAISYAGSPSLQSFFPSSWGIVLGACGVLTGVGIVLSVLAIHRRPARHLIGGAVILLLSIVSVVVASGGLIVGFVLAFVGGLWLFTWSPPSPARLPDQGPVGRSG